MSIFDVRRRAPTRSAFAVLFWWTAVANLVRGAFWLVYRLRCAGRAHVPRRGPIVYVANHQSHYDPAIVGCLVGDRPLVSLARASLYAVRPLAWVIRQIGAIPVRLGRADPAAMRAAIAELQAGGCVLIFAEGSRTRDGALGPFKPGVLTILKRANASVVPIAIEGAFDVWPIGQKYPKLRGRIRVKAAPAIPGDELLRDPPDVAMDRLRRQIETMRLELRRELRQATNGRYPAPAPGDVPYWQREV
ncbi:MAG: 1-acyl-sn-glycerol-3-phosphate acyltransferase [Planctomycetes bacterium]|nr:1-acyl-sn-glycerol-3-phosphate acyltransferase [Planctomycetota bacterium]